MLGYAEPDVQIVGVHSSMLLADGKGAYRQPKKNPVRDDGMVELSKSKPSQCQGAISAL